MARLPIETGSNTARNLSYFLFNLGDTRDKGLNALTNGLSGLGNTISDYYKTQRAFDEAAKERQRAENLQIQKMQQDEAYRQADLNLKKENLEFEKYKYNNPKPREMSVEDRLLLNAMDNFNNYNPNAVSNVSLEPNLQMPQQMPQQQSNVETIKPSNLRNAQLSQFFKDNSQEIQSIPQATNAKAQSPLINTAAVQDSARLNTGIAYFDNKEKLELGDYLLAKKMGVDLGKARGELSVKRINVGDTIKKANKTIRDLGEAGYMIAQTKDNAGIINGIDRNLHQITGGVWGLNPVLQNYSAMEQRFIREVAGKKDGRTTDQDIKDAKANWRTLYKDREGQLNTLGSFYRGAVRDLYQYKNDLEVAKYPIPQYLLEKINIYQGMVDYIDGYQNGKYPFSYKKWESMRTYAEGENSIYEEWLKIRKK